MKKMLTFILITSCIIALTTVYSWYVKKDSPALTYVPSTDWSPVTHRVPGSANTSGAYDCGLDGSANLHTVWIEIDREEGTKYLKHAAIDKKGNTVVAAQSLVTDRGLQNVTLGIAKDTLHIFWTGEDGQELNLYDTIIQPNGQLLSTTTIIKGGLNLVSDLQAHATFEEGVLLVYSDLVEKHMQLKSLIVANTGQPVGTVYPVTSGDINSVKPRLARDAGGRFYLTWKEYETGNFARLYCQQLTPEGQLASEKVLIAEGNLSPAAMAVQGEKLYLTWTGEKSMYETSEIFGTVIDLARPIERGAIRQLSNRGGRFSSQALAVDSHGQIHLTYLMDHNFYSSIAHQVFTNDFTQEQKAAKWIYPEIIHTADIRLALDDMDNLHMAWYQEGVRYANNIFARKTTPLQIIGLDAHSYRASAIGGLVYATVGPFLDLTLFFLFFMLIFGIVGVGFIYTVLYSLYCRYRPIPKQTNLYVYTSIICVLVLGFVLVLYNEFYLEWFMKILQNHFLFVVGVPFVSILSFIAVNKMKRSEVLNAAYLAVLWGYWVIMTIIILHLPELTFQVPPVVGALFQ